MISPRPPDPTDEYAHFISWLLKHRTKIPLNDRKIKSKFSNLNFHKLIKTVGNDKITIISASSHGITQEYIIIKDLSWAQSWSEYYENYRVHHGHYKNL
jgi:hypothetical protein